MSCVELIRRWRARPVARPYVDAIAVLLLSWLVVAVFAIGEAVFFGGDPDPAPKPPVLLTDDCGGETDEQK